MENTSVTLPQDLIRMILLRMPLKSLVTCTCVSKNLASTIRERQFRDEYLVRSLEMPRLLFIDDGVLGPDVLFHSVYQEKPLLSSGQQHVRISSVTACQFSNPVRGLVCLDENGKLRLCNPGAKKFATLPDIPGDNVCRLILTSFLGYDEVKDVFKVLCMKRIYDPRDFHLVVEATEHRVLTVGSGQSSWRPIICEHLHCPVSRGRGLYEKGVLYYVASSNTGTLQVMSFNVSSEKSTIIELPEGVFTPFSCYLVNYSGKLALVDNRGFESRVSDLNGDTFIEIWVRNETDGTWPKIRIDLLGWEEIVGNTKYIFRGTIRTGELVFAPEKTFMRSLSVLYYNIETNKPTRYKIEGVDEGERHIFRTWLDHIDNPLLI